MAQLLNNVDALRRSAAGLRISGPNVALGHLATHLADPTLNGKGAPRVTDRSDGTAGSRLSASCGRP